MRILYLILLITASSTAIAQQDTTRQFNPDSYRDKLTKADSSSQRVNNKIDSVQSKVNSLLNPSLSLSTLKKKVKPSKRRAKRDSLQFYTQIEKEKKNVKSKMDSLESAGQPTEKYQQQLDSLDQVKYEKKDLASVKTTQSKRKLNATKQKLSSKGDSLKTSTNKYKSKLDSVAAVPMNEVNKVQSKVGDAEQKLNAPVNKVESTVNEKLSLMNKEGGAGANLPTNATIPDGGVNTNLNLSQPDLDLKLDNPISNVDNPLQDQLGGVGEAKDKISEVKGIPQEQIGKVKSIDEVKGVQDKLGAANSITDKAQAYGGDVKNVAQGNLGEVKEAPKALENKAMKLDEVKGLQKEAGAFDQYKDMATKGNDPEAMKQLAMQQAQTAFQSPVNHFAGKEEVLKEAMDKMSKLKGKYSELNSLKDIPKRKPNEMRGKPLIERIVPGITLQIQKTKDVLIDYNPYLGYRFYGKFTAGAGWNERVSVGKHVHFSLRDRIYGPRVFADFKIKSGFSVRTDIEKMNTYIPSVAASGLNGDPGHRAWVWSAFIGIKKEYKFWGSVRGNAQFLYNLYDDHYNSPYADKVAVRMGFEFPMKKKIKDAH